MRRTARAGAGGPDRDAPVRLAVIIGSTREGRSGEAVARWFADLARGRGDLDVDVVDLADFELPDRYLCAVTPDVAAFTGRVERAEAFAVVTPEYNHSFPASLKQAIDYAYDEWRAKPVGFVAYGHGSEGLYAVEHLRTVFTELHMATVRARVTFDLLAGAPGPPPGGGGPARDAEAMLDQLAWWGLALREARAA
ncbi:NAD(P)H-dependent oxidoreductase, partial [Actinomadura vinacea]|uniref:NADPH-dependent FMN reductase n=1 Tax=Actinomadura vinacea TaxID=115336 RepID=UPI0031D757DB